MDKNKYICVMCGSKLEPDDNFCKYCGTHVDRHEYPLEE